VAGAPPRRGDGAAATALLPVLDAADPDGPRLLVEPTAGGGQALAATVQALEPWFDQLDHHELLGSASTPATPSPPATTSRARAG
jgi:hypothetical protein